MLAICGAVFDSSDTCLALGALLTREFAGERGLLEFERGEIVADRHVNLVLERGQLGLRLGDRGRRLAHGGFGGSGGGGWLGGGGGGKFL
jgi:hypothetical protein